MNTETVKNERFRDMAKAYVQGVRNSDPLQREAIENGRLSSEDMINRMEGYYREMAKANESENKEAPAPDVVEELISTTTVSLEMLLSKVVSEGSVLYKDSGTWCFYKDETTFDEYDWPDYTQEINESFEDFIRRVVESLAKAELEREDEHMIINTDLAIARSRY